MEAIEVMKKLKSSLSNYSFMKIEFGVVLERFPYNVNLSYASNKIRRDPRAMGKHFGAKGTPKTSSNIITLCVAVGKKNALKKYNRFTGKILAFLG